MFVSQPEIRQIVAQTMLREIAGSISERPGESAAQSAERSRHIISSVLDFQPRDSVEIMLAGLVVTHARLVQDAARDVILGQLDVLRARSSMAALDRGVIEFLRELRTAQARTLELDAVDVLWKDAAVTEPAADGMSTPEISIVTPLVQPVSMAPDMPLDTPPSGPPANAVNAPPGAPAAPSMPPPSMPSANSKPRVAPSPTPSATPSVPAPPPPAPPPHALPPHALPRQVLRTSLPTMPEPPCPLLPPLRRAETSIAAMMAVLSPPTTPYMPAKVSMPGPVEGDPNNDVSPPEDVS